MKLSSCIIIHNAKNTWGNGDTVGFFYMLTVYIIEIEICLVSIQQQNLSLENYVELQNITVQISTNMSQSS
jgi:hypothetical protein